jgi:hypothetical protein
LIVNPLRARLLQEPTLTFGNRHVCRSIASLRHLGVGSSGRIEGPDYVTTLPLSVLSNARTDQVTVALEAVENKIRQNSQGWEDAWIMVIMVRGDPPAKFKQIDQTGLREAGYGPEDF